MYDGKIAFCVHEWPVLLIEIVRVNNLSTQLSLLPTTVDGCYVQRQSDIEREFGFVLSCGGLEADQQHVRYVNIDGFLPKIISFLEQFLFFSDSHF